MIFDEGYFVCPRSIPPAVFNNEKWFKVWWWCLSETNFQDSVVPIMTGRGISSVSVKRGQFIFGRTKHSRLLNMKPSTLWKIILKFEIMEILNIKSNTHHSLITFCNYNEIVEPNNYAGTSKVTSKEQARNKQGTSKEHNIINEIKESNEKNGIKDPPTPRGESCVVEKQKELTVAEKRWGEFKIAFPKKNGKLQREETGKKIFFKSSADFQKKSIIAAKNYSLSADAKKGYILGLGNFLRDSVEEWQNPEQIEQTDQSSESMFDRLQKKHGGQNDIETTYEVMQ